ncbi:MAG: adenylate/guanylate cyclase domain-containing protein [Alphaproteobacteria bacterium]|nr:adenylate/guanylate cyclase domain-containing protein [Alphaproteobacteria bacterium]
MERRLAAILVADVVGYSRLMGEDETGTLERLNALRRDLVQPKITERKGRIVKLMGDGLLAEFPSVVEAVHCAVDVQREMIGREPEIAEEQRIRLRIGVNLGDIIVKSSDIFGDGVNVAARLEALADPGGICVSGTVFDHVKDKVRLDFLDLGEQRVKNIDQPVRVYQIALDRSADAGEGGGTSAEAAPLKQPDKPSIAVLPFDNMSGDVEQDYFADGMVEDIITGLSRIKWLFVIARNSSFAFKGKSVDVRQVGRQLGVRYVLEGSVRKASNRVRVTGQLIEAETGRHVWAERYDRALDDVFAIQDELTMSVVAAIEPSLRQAEIERVKRKRPDNLDAYDLALRAIPQVYPAMPDGAAKALPLLESALELEPDYAMAHGFAAWSHEILFARGGAGEASRLGAVRHAHAAIAHGRDDAIALSLGGFVMGLVAHDREAARQAFEAALALSPSCALTYNLGSVVMVFAGEADRSIEWGERALRLSPIDPMNYAPWFSITLGYFQRGEYQAAAEAAHKVFQANPYWSSAHFVLAATHAKLGRLDAAKSAAKRVIELQPGFSIGELCAAFDIHASIAAPLSEALSVAGLPE